MKNFIFFYAIGNWLFFNLNGSQIDLSNGGIFHEAYEKHPSGFYNGSLLNTADSNDNSLLELLLDYARLLVELEEKEIEDDLKVWFESQIDILFHLQNPVDYELYKKSLREDLEWFEVIYADLPVLKLIKDWINGL